MGRGRHSRARPTQSVRRRIRHDAADARESLIASHAEDGLSNGRPNEFRLVEMSEVSAALGEELLTEP